MNGMRKVTAGYALLMGTAQAITWIVLGFTGEVARMLSETPWETRLLLAAEGLMALVLIGAGASILRSSRWAPPLTMTALGMLIYCSILTFGVYADTGNIPAATFFGLLAASGLLLAALWTRDWARRTRETPAVRLRQHNKAIRNQGA